MSSYSPESRPPVLIDLREAPPAGAFHLLDREQSFLFSALKDIERRGLANTDRPYVICRYNLKQLCEEQASPCNDVRLCKSYGEMCGYWLKQRKL